MGQHDRDHTGNFTQVRAAVRRKTLLLLWWIDGGRMMVRHSTLPGRGCLRAIVATRIWVCALSNFLTLSPVAMGLLL